MPKFCRKSCFVREDRYRIAWLFVFALSIVLCLLSIRHAQTNELDVGDIFRSLNAVEPDPPQAPEKEKQEENKPDETMVLDENGLPVLTPLLNRLLYRFNRNTVWGGYIRNETAFRIVRPTAMTKIRNIVQLEGKYPISRRTTLSARGQCFYDAVYDVESVDVIHPRKGPDQILEEDPQGDAVLQLDPNNPRGVEIVKDRCEMKEFFLDLNYRHVDVRIGEQIVRWGVVEGARVLDEINPLDFDELILRNIDDRYIPLFMVKTNLYFGSNTLEAIYIPEVRGHRPAPRATQWEQFRILPGVIKPENAWEDFPDHLENAEYAFRYTRVFTGFEISGSYFYTWDDFPSSFRSITREGALNTNLNVNFKPEFNRLKIYGFSLAKSFSRFVLNAEMTYVLDKFFGARFDNGVNAVEGEIQSDYIKYALGVDLYAFDMDISPAVIQQYILDYDDPIIVERLDTVAAVFLQKELLHNIWSLNLLLLYFINDDNWLVRPRTHYNFTDRLRISFGVDIFEGKIGSGQPGQFNFIGFFDNNDRIYWELTYSF
ncbi:hypothetical protein JYT87_02095 [Nitrospira defluvii]|nr:hypothetical protein [Nitrospira defluvii]